jgi:hypothetical protein
MLHMCGLCLRVEIPMEEVEAGVEEKEQSEDTTLNILILLRYPSVLNRTHLPLKHPRGQDRCLQGR